MILTMRIDCLTLRKTHLKLTGFQLGSSATHFALAKTCLHSIGHRRESLMTLPAFRYSSSWHMLCAALAFVIVSETTVSSWAQTNAAQQAVRQRVSGLEGGTPGETPPPNE